MEFGIFSQMHCPEWDDEHSRYHREIDVAILCDQMGFKYDWSPEHHFLQNYSHQPAPEVFLSFVAARTKQIHVGTAITNITSAVNHPARVAERIATMDHLSKGRVEFGTGRGSSSAEWGGFAIPSASETKPMWRESLEQIPRMWRDEPYGFEGKYFRMPERNVLPKPYSKPHPPLWVACSNRDTIKLAARMGIGALTFAFIDPSEAKYWVDEYYETFKNECTPIGRAVNPNIAMVTGFMCHEDSETAVRQGLEGFKFFGYALAHYYITGTHVPARTDIWEQFKSAPPFPMMPTGGIGNPDEVRKNLETFENVGVDQAIFIQQGGNNRHEDICSSLELFASRVQPDFKSRHAARQQKKMEALAPYIEKAMAKIPPLDEAAQIEPIESYPVLMSRLGVDISQLPQRRNMGPAVQQVQQALAGQRTTA
jgi:alkanesulfonate monooxygenase SsuD/methylene tetrahydromethanopterin reductase-like flavin-dependent oxidoreductase (luciferase family)